MTSRVPAKSETPKLCKGLAPRRVVPFGGPWRSTEGLRLGDSHLFSCSLPAASEL